MQRRNADREATVRPRGIDWGPLLLVGIQGQDKESRGRVTIEGLSAFGSSSPESITEGHRTLITDPFPQWNGAGYLRIAHEAGFIELLSVEADRAD